MTLADELKSLTPEERVRRLKQIQEKKKKDLKEKQKEIEKELEVTEDLIRESEDDIEEEELKHEEEQEKEHEDLEKKLEEVQGTGQDSGLYKPAEGLYSSDKPGNLYHSLEEAKEIFDKLENKDYWTKQEEQEYIHAKDQVIKAQAYELSSDKLRADLGLASNALQNLYKN